MKTNKNLDLIPVSFLLLFFACCCASNSIAQPIMPAMNGANGVTSSSSSVENTNSDFREWNISSTAYSMKVIVWDGSSPGLSWDDGGGNVGTIVLGGSTSGVQPYNPDVSLSIDAAWAIVVYQDLGNSDNIVAEWYRLGSTGYTYYNRTVLFESGANPKIDNDAENKFAIVWMKQAATYGAIYSCIADLSGSSGSPYFYSYVVLEDASSGTHSEKYFDPDVTINNDDVYYTYIYDDGTNNYVYVEYQTRINVQSNTLAASSFPMRYSAFDYSYSKPRISSNPVSNYLSYSDWAVVAQVENLNASPTRHEIHGFVKYQGSNPSSFYVYNTGYFQGTNSYDICNVPNYDPVISYIGDYIYFLWTINNNNSSTGTYSSIVNKDIIAIRTKWDGYSFALNAYPSDYLIVNECQPNNQFAPSISGRYAINTSYFLATFFSDNVSGCNTGIDVYNKSEWYNATTPFRLKSINNQNALLSTYPEPFTNELNINVPFDSGKNSTYKISVKDVYGRIIFENAGIKEDKFKWDASNKISSGIYFLTIIDENNNIIATKQLVKL